MAAELRVLGPLEVVGPDGPVVLPGRKHRRLLAALAVGDGRPHSADQLADALWGPGPPVSSRKLVQLYVSQIRKVLPRGIRIVTTAAGYALEVDGGLVDGVRFGQLADGAADALAAGETVLALSLADQALRLWHGRAYGDLRDEEFARAEAERLEELRIRVAADRIDAMLRLGRHDSALAEAVALADAEPLHERAQALAITALYRTGRQADALARYAAHRRHLDEELGLEPAAALRELQRRILRQDPTLDGPAETGAPNAAASLPVPATPLVGREREREVLAGLLALREARLIVLTGAGGSGKTRLALEAARWAAADFAHGAAFVELAPLREAELVLPTIAAALGVPDVPGREPLEALTDALRSRELLLVVDNVEHVRDVASAFVELLARAPHLCVVVTSRVVLHVSGEHVLPVPPLAEDDAVELFRQCAARLRPSFELTPANEEDVREICRRLDGLPLAIELVAGWTGTLTPGALRQRLDRRLGLLTRGPRDLPARQQTLRETIDWSVGLLTDEQRDVYARLAVFPGGASLTAAEAVCGASLVTLAVLLDHNVVRRVDAGGEPRFGMLETIREHALDLLAAESARIELAAAEHLSELLDHADLKGGPDQGRVMALLDAELDNIRAAIGYAHARGEHRLALLLAGGMYRYWWIRGLTREGLDHIREAIAAADGTRTAALALALQGGAGLAWSVGDHDTASVWAGRAVEIAREVGSTWDELAAETVLGLLAGRRLDFDAARRHHRRSMELKLALGREPLVEKMNLANVELDAGEFASAAAGFEELLDIHRRAPSLEGIGLSLLNLGLARYRLGHVPEAEACFTEAGERFDELGFEAHVAHARQGLAACAVASGRAAESASLLGAAARVLERLGWSEDDFDPSLPAEVETTARAVLGDVPFDEAYRSGSGVD